MEIKRYNFEAREQYEVDNWICQPIEDSEGEYVLYSDHLSALSEKDKEIERLKNLTDKQMHLGITLDEEISVNSELKAELERLKAVNTDYKRLEKIARYILEEVDFDNNQGKYPISEYRLIELRDLLSRLTAGGEGK